MSDYGLRGDLDLDIQAALDQANRVEQAFARALTGEVRIEADTSGLAQEVASAVDAADTEVIVTGEADSLTGDVTSAIDAADATVPVDGDTTGLGAGIGEETSKPRTAPVGGDTTSLAAELRRVTEEANAELRSLDAGVEIDLGAVKRLARQVQSEFSNADARVTVTADTAAVIAQVEAALRSDIDATARIQADTSGVAGAVTAAVDAADSQVSVTADTTGVDEATDGVDALNTALIASTQSGLSLRAALQLGGLGAAAGAIYQVVDAASALEQSVGGTDAIFGQAQQGVSGFAQTAAEAAGLTEESARTLTSQIGGLLQGFGFTQQEAAELSVVMAQLGADLSATFGGTSQEAVEALGAAFRGETDPIERFGISLNATQADLRAVELGLASSTSQVSANARAQGVLSLIMERSAQAQGQFGREVDTTAGQVERARAEFGNMAADVGSTLQPAINDLVASARSELIPTLGELGKTVGPAVGDALLALGPALGGFMRLIIAATPVIELFAAIIDAVPTPVLTMIGTFLALQRVAGPIGGLLSKVGEGFQRVRSDASGLASAALSPVNIALAAGTIAFSLYADQQAKAAQISRDIAADQQGLQSALSSSVTVIDGVTTAIEELVESGEGYRVLRDEIFDKGIEVDIGQVFSDANADVDQFSEALLRGGDAFDRYVDGLGGTSDEAQFAREAIRSLGEDMQAAAEETIDSGVTLAQWTESAAEAAIAANTSADGTVNYAAALQALKDEARASAEQQEALAAATANVDAGTQTASINALGLSLIQLQGQTADVERDFVTFALAADAAGLSGSELDAVAEELGVTSEGLSAAIDGVAQPIRELADAAAASLPSLTDLAGNIEDFSVQGFRDRLAEAFEAVVNFQANLQALADNPRAQAAAAVLGPEFAQQLADAARDGRSGVLSEIDLLLAGLEAQGVNLNELITGEIGPNLATSTGQVGATITEQFGANYRPQDVIPESARQVEEAVLGQTPALQEATGGYGRAGAFSFELGFRPNAGPGLQGANAQVENDLNPFAERTARHGRTGGFSFELGFRPNAGPGLGGANSQVEADINPFSERNARHGSGGASGFSRAFKPNARPGLDGAHAQVSGAGPSFFGAGSSVGSSGATGFGFGIGGMPGKATGATSAAISAVSGQTGAASSAGYSVGSSIGSGLVSGVSAWVGEAVSGAVNLVNAAINAAKQQAGVASPSKVFRDEVGIPIGQGLVAGMDAETDHVAERSAALVTAGLDAAVAAVDTTPIGVTTPLLPVGVPSATAFGGQVAGTVVYVQDGAIRIQVPDGRPESIANGRAAADALTLRLAGRRTSVITRTR